MKKSILLGTFLVLGLGLLAPKSLVSQAVLPEAQAQKQLEDEEFNGPFASWLNVKTVFGAKGDGVTDDTAAIQAAIDKVAVNVEAFGGNAGGRVLYFPAGTYKITKTLLYPNGADPQIFGGGLIGEDPAKTIIKWAGADDGVMLWVNGVNSCSFGRLTWDGDGRALACVQHSTQKHYSTNNQHFDSVFQNARYGFYTPQGAGDAECPLYRCKFINCSGAGVYIRSGNTYNFWIWYSEFRDCAVGAQVWYGSVNVFHSNFYNSSLADIKVGDARYFSARDNFSRGSNRFLSVEPLVGETQGGNAGCWVLQNNRVVEPKQSDVVQFGGGWGLFYMIGNQIASPNGVAAGPVVKNVERAGTNQASYFFNNKFTVSSPIEAPKNPPFLLDNSQVSAASISKTPLVLPVTPPKVARPVIEVIPPPPGPEDNLAKIGRAAIQNAIDKAAAMPAGTRPVVHLGTTTNTPPAYAPWYRGNIYFIDRPIVVPANVQMTISGDGQFSRIFPAEGFPEGQPTMLLRGPSRVTLRDLRFYSGLIPNTYGVIADNCDQPGGRVFMNLVSPKGKTTGLFVDGLANAKVNLHNMMLGAPNHVRVVGPATPGSGRTAIFAAATSHAPNHIFRVENGGRLLARDFWFEQNSGKPEDLLRFAGSGAQPAQVSLECAYVYNSFGGAETQFPAATFDSFNGSFTMMAMGLDGKIRVTGDSSKQKTLVMGYGQLDKNSVLNGPHLLMQTGTPTLGRADANFIREMTKFPFGTSPEFINTLPEGVSDLRVLNTYVDGQTNDVGILLTPKKWELK